MTANGPLAKLKVLDFKNDSSSDPGYLSDTGCRIPELTYACKLTPDCQHEADTSSNDLACLI